MMQADLFSNNIKYKCRVNGKNIRKTYFHKYTNILYKKCVIKND